MKAPNKEVRKYVYDLLNGDITLSSTVIPVTSSPKKDTGKLYIQIGNISVTDFSTKDKYITKCLVEIAVIGVYADEATNYTQVEEISSQILDLLIDNKGETVSFKVDWVHFINSVESMAMTEAERIIENIITIELLTEEK